MADAAAPCVRPNRLIRSAGIRFGLIYAGLFAASAAALALFLWWSTAGLLDRQTDAAINADTVGLAERYRDAGLPGLEESIEQRLADNIDDDAIYLLTTPDMGKLAGNLNQWPSRVTMDQEWFGLPITRAGVRGVARLRQFELPSGYHLLVGRDVKVRAQMARLLTDGLLWAAVLVIALGTVGAFAVRGLFRLTLADVSATAMAISAGDLSRRVRVAGRGDEFDRLAETINDMLDRIGRLMDGVRQVSNAIAHDLRTPIARARTRLEDAARPGATEAELRAGIERAIADLDDVVSVFHALLRISEIEAGARRSAFAQLDLSPLLLDLVELYAMAAEERGQSLAAAVPPSLPAFGDRDMIQQAVANLLDNALKFSPAGSAIAVEAMPVKPGTDESSGAWIAVADHGPGIPAADRARAANRFFRGEDARSTPGSGLGLALVQAVAQLHEGTLRLEDNAPGLRAVLTLATYAEAGGQPHHGVLTAVSPASHRPVMAEQA